jgi:hypothetical protein
MPANTAPIYTRTPQCQGSIWTSSLTANADSDGTGTIGTDMVVAFTADATEGSRVERLRYMPCASVPATATTATVLRVYISTVSSGATTRGNTFLFAEVACPATTANQTTVAVNPIEIPMGVSLEPGETVLWSMHHAAAANTSWSCIAFGGRY